MKGVNINNSKLNSADFSEADLSYAYLKECDLCNATLTKTCLENANITKSILYGTSRDEWKIKNIKCDLIFWDQKGEISDPKNGTFKKGEFEEFYEELPKFEYVFINGFTPIDAFLIDQVVQDINSQNPNFKLNLDSFHSRGKPRAVFTIRNKAFSDKALEKVKLLYENRILSLESERDTLEKCFSLAIKEPRFAIRQLGFGDIIEPKMHHGDITIIKDKARVETVKIINKAADDLVAQVKTAILASNAPVTDKKLAGKQLHKIEEELKKNSPEKSSLKKYCEYIGRYLPDVTKNIPWKKLIERIFIDML